MTNLLVLGASIVGSLLLAEVLAALVMPSIFVSTDILGRRIANRQTVQTTIVDGFPELARSQNGRDKLLSSYDYDFQINSIGLRYEEIDHMTSNGCRILVMGDSQTFGIGVEQHKTFSTVLESRLRTAAGVPVQVINAGVPGTGQVEQLRRLKRLLRQLHPDLVLAVAHVDNALVRDEGNDLINNYVRLHRDHAAEYHVPRRSKIPFLAEHSHLYGMLSSAKRGLLGQPSYLDQVRNYATNELGSERHQTAWNELRELLQQMERASSTIAHSATVVVYLPGLASLAMGDATALSELQRAGLPLISTFDALLDGAQGDLMRLRFPHDGHYNAFAHRLIADAIAKGLEPHISLRNRRSACAVAG